VTHARRLFAVALIPTLAWVVAPVAEAQPPIRIGASLSQTGLYATPGQNQLRGYQLCVKHMNEKGGVLGRKLELVVYDDGSDPAAAARLYEKLITQDKVDLVLGPYTTPITDAVAQVNEKYRMPMVAPLASATSIYRKGRKFIFSMLPPAEVYFEGLIDIAAKKGLKTVDRDGLQIAHRMVMFQWQDGKKVIVWPEELAPGKPRFPTPPWSQRP
jgi:branched-chain amino acid transport system substrate-binding protein